MKNNNCTCTAKICCNAWHEIRPDGGLLRYASEEEALAAMNP